MVALPANNTDRVFFDYVTGNLSTSREHTCAVRFNLVENTVEAVQGAFLDLLGALGETNFRAGWRVLRTRVQYATTSVSLPYALDAALGAFVGTGGSPTYNARFETVEDTFQGRSSSSGRRVDFSLYRAMDDAESTFRVEAGLSGLGIVVGQAVATLNTYAPAGIFISIDGTGNTIWYPYMNRNYNSYWERRSRLG